jgi:hypothetical protein
LIEDISIWVFLPCIDKVHWTNFNQMARINNPMVKTGRDPRSHWLNALNVPGFMIFTHYSPCTGLAY